MEERPKEISKNKPKNITLIGKCEKCGKSFEAEAELPIINFCNLEGNSYKGLASPHLVTLCPFCCGLLNLALRTETEKRRGVRSG